MPPSVEKRHTLFVYGTLRCPACLESVIGRRAELAADKLEGYRRGKIRLGKALYPAIRPAAESCVDGFCIEVSEEELRLLDGYETAAYRRVRVRLASGCQAWVFEER